MARKKQTQYVVANEAGGVFKMDELSPAVLRHIELGNIELIDAPVVEPDKADDKPADAPAGDDSADAPVED
jgi:hypothetical protein